MINFREIRGFLLAALEQEGFSERRDKSCRQYRVFSDGGTTLLVQPNAAGEYDYYSNPDDTEDYGDVTHFILSRKLGIRSHGELKLERTEFLRLQRELERLGAYASSDPAPPSPRGAYGRARQRPPFRLADHPVIWPASSEDALRSVERFLRQRGITIDPTHPDLAESIASLRTPSGYYNTLFLWRDAAGKTVGAQYKYITSDKASGHVKCVKRFLPHSVRDSSLWWTPLEGRSGLFVCEDPLDALAHRQLYPEKNYAYAATGGFVTPGQIELIYRLWEEGRGQFPTTPSSTPNEPAAGKNRFALILGNDNDTAGQLANLRILLPGSRILYDKTAGTAAITYAENNTVAPTEETPADISGRPPCPEVIAVADFADYIRTLASSVNIPVKVAHPTPPAKDWNDMLLR